VFRDRRNLGLLWPVSVLLWAPVGKTGGNTQRQLGSGKLIKVEIMPALYVMYKKHTTLFLLNW